MSPLDLHVLGTPPAFVLSQDQTLAFNPLYLSGVSTSKMQTHSELLSLCLRYSCSVSFSRFSARRLACASRASLFILSSFRRNVNTFSQLFLSFFTSFCICERLKHFRISHSGICLPFACLRRKTFVILQAFLPERAPFFIPALKSRPESAMMRRSTAQIRTEVLTCARTTSSP